MQHPGIVSTLLLWMMALSGCGDSTGPVRIEPDDGPWVAVSAGDRHACGLAEGGILWCWGSNALGQLGTSTSRDSSAWMARVLLTGSITAVAAGPRHSCVLDTGGAVWCWGDNVGGQLGDGTLTGRTRPVRAADSRTFEAITAGVGFTCGLDAAGSAWCWGTSPQGELGRDDLTGTCQVDLDLWPCSLVPIAVQGGHGFTRIVAGRYHACGLDPDRRAWCWGDNSTGQLGRNDVGDGCASWADRCTAEPVEIAGGHRFVQLEAGNYHTCGIEAGGSAWCWGFNGAGQLGAGAEAIRGEVCHNGLGPHCWFEPVPVAGALAFQQLALGSRHTCGIASGAVFCWGDFDGRDVLTDAPAAVPVAVPTAFSRLAAGSHFSCATTDRGVLYCWGVNDAGQLGIGSYADAVVPTRVKLPARD